MYSDEVIKAARKLADEGIRIHNSYVEPAFTSLTISNTNMKLENGYLVSEEITAATKGVSKINIKVTGGEAIEYYSLWETYLAWWIIAIVVVSVLVGFSNSFSTY